MTSDHIQQKIVFLLTDVHEAARAGDWTAVRDKTEEVLRLNPFNHDARAHWMLAKNGGVDPNDTVDTRIALHLEAARVALENEDWAALGEECRLVLELDPANAEAEGYLRTAEETIIRLSTRGGRREQAIAAAQSPPRPKLLDVPAVPAAEGTYADNDRLTAAATAIVALVSLLYLGAGGFYLWGAGIVDKVARSSAPFSDATSFDGTARLVSMLLVAAFAASGAVYLAWVYREVANARAMGLTTRVSPSLAAIASIVPVPGGDNVLRDLMRKLGGGVPALAQVALVVWVLALIGGAALNVYSTRQPTDHAEWASLLQLTAFGSLLLGVSGFALIYALRQTHALAQQRYIAPHSAASNETTQAAA